jgi:hypothetical protein
MSRHTPKLGLTEHNDIMSGKELVGTEGRARGNTSKAVGVPTNHTQQSTRRHNRILLRGRASSKGRIEKNTPLLVQHAPEGKIVCGSPSSSSTCGDAGAGIRQTVHTVLCFGVALG